MKKSIFTLLATVAAAIVGLSSCSQEATANNGDGLNQEQDPGADVIITPLYVQRVSEFMELEITENDIVLVGNSLISRGEWNELLKNNNVKNRGISGDTTRGILERIDMIATGKPAMIFLMVGINDLMSGVSTEGILTNMTLIIHRIRELSPKTKIFLHGMLPVGPAFYPYVSDRIPLINAGYQEIADTENVTYIDMYTPFLDTDKVHLRKDLTNDDLHLLGKGFVMWASILSEYIQPSI